MLITMNIEHPSVLILFFEITNGEFPRKQKRLVQAWAELHIDELKANWKLAMNEEPVYKINPL